MIVVHCSKANPNATYQGLQTWKNTQYLKQVLGLLSYNFEVCSKALLSIYNGSLKLDLIKWTIMATEALWMFNI